MAGAYTMTGTVRNTFLDFGPTCEEEERFAKSWPSGAFVAPQTPKVAARVEGIPEETESDVGEESVTAELPSRGSVGHDEGTCRRCCFFPKGRCDNGADCGFCHFDHDKRKRGKRSRRGGASGITETSAMPAPKQDAFLDAELSTSVSRSSLALSSDSEAAGELDMCVKNTFLHFGEAQCDDDELQEPFAKSCPSSFKAVLKVTAALVEAPQPQEPAPRPLLCRVKNTFLHVGFGPDPEESGFARSMPSGAFQQEMESANSDGEFDADCSDSDSEAGPSNDSLGRNLLEVLGRGGRLPALPDTCPAGLPSRGSVGHEEGTCKRCCFFPKGRCENGADCGFCHFDHEKRKRKSKRSRMSGMLNDGAFNRDALPAPVLPFSIEQMLGLPPPPAQALALAPMALPPAMLPTLSPLQLELQLLQQQQLQQQQQQQLLLELQYVQEEAVLAALQAQQLADLAVQAQVSTVLCPAAGAFC